ncbi:nicotinate-nucleotide adenylyltransferase [Myxacorys almedinensis A]|uniref:Phosphopantetheine adenylyltransferase n=2 Tax=Myxacorys TaxID=2056239 RepID=A0A8J8CKI3_9CYAN|nr:nicotinate-nucleotide adenylyltransferase [Myxacorys almedinensis A]
MLTIALFGTSADPPTIGHLEILRSLSPQFDEIAVWAADNPFKADQTPLEHRTQMLRLLIQDLHCPKHNVWVYPELSHARTVVTVERAKQRWQGAEFTLIVGFDVARQLPKWFHVEELLQHVNVLIVPRSGYSLDAADVERLRQMGATVAIAEIAVPEVSSTAYRTQEDLTGVTHAIQAYIDREQLYGCDVPIKKQPVH